MRGGPQMGEELFGRDADLAQLRALLQATRLVTVTGPAGIGKSALVDSALRAAFGEVLWVRLGGVAGDRLAAALSRVAGVAEQPGRSVVDGVAVALRDRARVLVFDDADDVRGAAGPLIDHLLLECPDLRVIVTSREPIRARHEVIMTLAPLDDVAAATVLERAHPAATPDDLLGVARRLGGVPLALVVAGRALAAGGTVDVAGDAVGETLATVLGAVLDRLSPADREAVARLAALPAGSIEESYAPLVEAGLAVTDVVAPRTRYRLLPAVVDVARRTLTPAEHRAAALSRMAACEEWLARLSGPRSPAEERDALDEVDREYPNIAVALTWAIEGGHAPEDGARLAFLLSRFLMARARFDEGARWTAIAGRVASPVQGRLVHLGACFAQSAGRLAAATAGFEHGERWGRDHGDPGVLALSLLGQAQLAFFASDPARARRLIDDAQHEVVAAADDAVLLTAAGTAGMLGRITGDLEVALAEYEDAVQAARRIPDYRSLAVALLGLGSVHHLRGDLDRAEVLLHEGREVAEQAGYPAPSAMALGTLGMLAATRGDDERAREFLARSLAAAQRAGDHRTELESLLNLGSCDVDRGDPATAAPILSDALSLARRQGDRRVAGFALAGLAECRLMTGDLAAAARLQQQALIIRRDLGDRRALAVGLEESAAIVVSGSDGPARAGRLLAAAEALRSGTIARTASEEARVAHLRAGGAPAGPRAALRAVPASVARALAWLEELTGHARERAGAPMSALAPLPPARPTGMSGKAGPSGGAPPPGAQLAVVTLGGFSLIVDGEPVPAAAWGSRRARQLVKMLIAARGRPVARQQVAAVLWPDATAEEEDRLPARVSVLLSTARRFVGPALMAGGDTLALDLDRIHVDVEAFLAAVARDQLGPGVELYTGDFLPEDVYEDWSVPLREQARLAFLGAVRRLARVAAADGDHDRAASLGLRVLEADPYDDAAHRLLIGSLAAAGQHGGAVRAHEHYAARMAELGVDSLPLAAVVAEHRRQAVPAVPTTV